MGFAAFIEVLWPYVAGAWFFILSRDFRGKTLSIWRSRRGLSHLRTVMEVLIAGFFGFFPLTIPSTIVLIKILTG
jgi:energy-converting hydrogenase Eha subunit G